MPTPPAPTTTDAVDTLLRHFPAEVREAYCRFQADRLPADADVLVLAVVRDHIPEKRLRFEAPPADAVQLVADLGFDSVAITEMVFFLEDLFQVRISNDEILRVRSVGDLRAFVRAKVANPSSTTPA